MELFSKIPTTPYNQFTLLNILSKITPLRENFKKLYVYYDYQIKDGERPDTIAYDYYGSSTYAWLVMIVNDMYDVYNQWPRTYREFYDYLKRKYGYVYELKSEIHHYVYEGIEGDTSEEIKRKNYLMTPETFNSLTPIQRSGWVPVSVYDWENDLNESKRTIKLLSNKYTKLVDREVSEIFSSG